MAVIYFGARACDQRSPPLNALWTIRFSFCSAIRWWLATPGSS